MKEDNPMFYIRRKRQEQGLKLAYVAKKVGMSTAYLSELERSLKRISYNDYISILDVLGYEVEVKEKRREGNINMNNNLNEKAKFSKKIQDNIDETKNINIEKFTDVIKNLDKENNLLITALEYKLKYCNHSSSDIKDFNNFTNSLSYLSTYDKELLKEINTLLIHLFTIIGKNKVDWTEEENDMYMRWTHFDCEIFDRGEKYRDEYFNMIESDKRCGDPAFVRHYILKTGEHLYLRYWLSPLFVEYRFGDVVDLKTLNSPDFLYEDMHYKELVEVDKDNNVIIVDNEIFNHILDTNKKEILELVQDIVRFDVLFGSQISFTFDIIELVSNISNDVLNIKKNPDNYNDEFKEFMQNFIIG